MKYFFILAGISLFSSAAMAQLELTAKSNSKLSSFLSKFREKSSMSFFSIYSGPGVNNLGVNTVDANGKLEEDSYTSNWVQLSYRYDLTDSTRLVINPRFSIAHSSKAQDQYELLNPVLGITTTWWSSGDWSFVGGINTIVFPVEKGTLENKLLANPGGFNSLNYNRPSWAAGLWVWGRAYIYDGSEGASKSDYEMILSPYYEYKFSDSVRLRGFFDQYFEQQAGQAFTHVNNTGNLTAGIGLDTMVTSSMGIYPYLRVDAGNEWSWDTTSIGAWIYGSIF